MSVIEVISQPINQSADDFRAELRKLAEESLTPPSPQGIEVPAMGIEPQGNAEEIAEEKAELKEELESKFDNNKVPQKRFSEEVAKRRELESKYEQERLDKARLEGELQAFKNNRQQPQQQEYAAPEINPIDEESHRYLESKINAIAKENEQLKNYLVSQHQQNDFNRQITAKEKEFTATTPDFNNAVQYLEDLETKSATMAFGDKGREFVTQKYAAVVENALKNGQNPAEIVYNIAKSYGYNSTPANNEPTKTSVQTLRDNMKKSGSAPSGYSPSPTGGQITNIEQTVDPKTGRVDKDKFREALRVAGRNIGREQ